MNTNIQNRKIKPYKKAWKLIFYGGDFEYNAYGETGAKATSDFIKEDEGNVGCWTFSDVRYLERQRNKELDLYKQELDPKLKDLDKKHLEILIKSLGLDTEKEFPKKISIDHFKCDDYRQCNDLCRLGLLDYSKDLSGYKYYYVTDAGIEASKTLCLIKKK